MKYTRAVSFTLILSFLFSASVYAEVSLAIYPWKNSETTYSRFKLLSEELARHLGDRVKLVLSKDKEAFWHELAAGKFDIVLLEQNQFLQLSKSLPYELVAAAEKTDVKQDRSVLVVMNESAIKSIRDIRGKQVILSKDHQNLADYILPLQLLKTARLTEPRDFKILYSPDPHVSLESIIHSDQLVAGISEARLNQLIQANSAFAGKIRLLATSTSYPTFDCWTIKSTLPEQTRQRIQAYLAGLGTRTEAARLDERAGYARIYPITLRDLDATAQALTGR